MNNYRLTVHVENQPKVDTNPVTKKREKGPQKNAYEKVLEQSAIDRKKFLAKKQNKDAPKVDNKGRYKVYTTLSFLCKTRDACMTKLAEVRSKYDIAIGKDVKKPKKFRKELWQISFVN